MEEKVLSFPMCKGLVTRYSYTNAQCPRGLDPIGSIENSMPIQALFGWNPESRNDHAFPLQALQ